MKLEDCTDIRLETVDGEPIYILNTSVFSEMRDDPSIDGISLGGPSLLKLLWSMMDFVECHPDFSLTLYRYPLGPAKWRWLFSILMNDEGIWQRVHIEQVICNRCSWEGKIANPTEPSLYDTVPNSKQALENAWKQSKVSCPKCNNELPRYAIWVEPNNRV